MKTTLALGILLASAAELCAQGGVGQKEIDQAITRGLEYLHHAPSTAGWLGGNCDELILLTMIHGGSSEKVYGPLLKNVLEAPLEKTYKVSLLAMCLEELDPSKYQVKIAQCAQFLVDNQCHNGQWTYGSPTAAANEFKFDEPSPAKKAVESGPKSAKEFGAPVREHKRPSRSITIKQTKQGPDAGDNSNSQYASLGLRACFDSNVRVPDEVLFLARKWWVESQYPDESGLKQEKNAVTTGAFQVTRIQGWSYKSPSGEQKDPYHAMTAGAVGAAVIYEYMLKRDWKKDVVTLAGVNWLGKHFSVNTNYYYMYALERAGMLFGTEKFGDHDWYWEGAKLIVNAQKADGSWGDREKKEENTWDTCFAILFLKKATRAIATGDGRR